MKVNTRSVVGSVLCLLASCLVAHAREPATYFAKPAKASKPAASAAANVTLPPPLPAKSAVVLPPLELPPLPPAPVPLSPAKPATPKPAPGVAASPAPAEEKPTEEPAAKPEKGKESSSPFLSRAALEEKRQRCKLEFTGTRALVAKPAGASLAIRFKSTSGEGCLAAASSDAEWVEVAMNSRTNEVTLVVEPNRGQDRRSSLVNVLAGKDSFVFTLEQEPQARGCRRAAFTRRSNAPIPDGFEP